MIFLGSYKAGASVFYAANFHNDQGTLEDPTSPTARLRDHAGTWSDLTTPAKQDTKTGHYGGAVDTTGFSAGQHVIRLAGTVATAKNVATEFCFQVVAYDPADGVRLGLTALPNAAPDAAGGLPISDAGGLDLDAKLANTNEVTAARMGALTDWIDGGRLDLILDARSSHSAADVWAVGTRTLTAFDAAFKTGYSLSAAGVQAIWDALTSALTTVGSIGKLLVDNVNATISSRSSHAAADVATAIGGRTPSAQLGAPTTYDGLIYFIRQFAKNKLDYDKGADTMILYEDDGTTAKLTHAMTDNAGNATRNAGT